MVDVGAIDRTAGSAPSTMRPTLAGTRHMVSAGHYLAAHAGFAILEAGGNAVDAGIAAGLALGVVQSDFVNVAGVAPILIRMAATGEVWSVAGLGAWPKAASLDLFLRDYGGAIPVGILRTVVPAAPDAWITALARFGTMSFGEVASAAIRFASDGFAMYPLMAEMIETNAAGYRRWPSSAAVYLPGGRPPRIGELFRQSDLAASLQYMADQERAAAGDRAAGLQAARDAFYRGDIAGRIVAYHRENGGFLAMEDLAAFRAEVEPALRTSFRGLDVYSCGFWCQGPALLQMLNMLEPCDLAGLGHNSADYVHTLTEVVKLAFADRSAFYGDPRRVDVPAAALLSKAYAAERFASVRADRAWSGPPPEGSPRDLGDHRGTDPTLDTSFVAVVDRDGNAFSATPSDASNNTPVIPGTGLCPSSRGSQSWAVAGHPATIEPGRRPRLTPNPAMAVRRGVSVMPFGTPGGDVQTQAMLQTLLNIEVFGMDLQQAVEAPRFATFSFPSSFEPHGVELDRLAIESLLDPAIGPDLAARGHAIQWWQDRNWRAGATCVVRHDLETGIRWAGADPRRPSYAVGW
ncbi:MAG: gamma-glutamyltransferase [Enterovirga sp.]|nr:gamma-glutamyltransferase [Enterovirga sp.]